jgi:hypothetical protein
VRVLPYRRLTIETSLPPEEVVHRLTAELYPPPSKSAMRRSLEGWIIGDTVEIRRPRTLWNVGSFLSVAEGRIVPGPMGTCLELTLTIDPVGRALLSLWMWFAGALFVGFGIAYLRDTTFGREAGPVGLVLLPFGYLLCLASFRVDTAKVEYRLRRLLDISTR